MNESIFDTIKHINEYWNEYWSAREFYKILGYTEYRKFLPVIKKAKIACENSLQSVEEHFAQVSEPQKSRNQYGETIWQMLSNYRLSRYACYLIIQNADPSKEVVALWQTYFAIQTRKQEINEWLLEDTRRMYLREEMKKQNKNLAETAKNAWVESYWIFMNYGYMWLYNWLKANDIHKKKRLKKSQHILDHMWSEELAANLFRTTQAGAKLKREKTIWEQKANKAHFDVWKEVRITITKLWWTMPEDLPTAENIKKSERKLKQAKEDKKINNKNIKNLK